MAGWLIASACILTLVAARVSGAALRIIEGRGAHPGEFPYVVQLEHHIAVQIKNQTTIEVDPYCTGAALKPTWTLTAGHCEGINSLNKMIRYGFPNGVASINDSFSSIYGFKKFTEHRNMHIFDDVGLVFSEPIVINKYAKISAVDFTTLFGHRITVVGFGLMLKQASKPTEMKAVYALEQPLQVWDKAMLRSCEGEFYPSICVVPECGDWKGVFFGDSGGPVLHPSGIIGVNSRIYPGSVFYRTGMSLVVTPVSPYVDWISSLIRNENL